MENCNDCQTPFRIFVDNILIADKRFCRNCITSYGHDLDFNIHLKNYIGIIVKIVSDSDTRYFVESSLSELIHFVIQKDKNGIQSISFTFLHEQEKLNPTTSPHSSFFNKFPKKLGFVLYHKTNPELGSINGIMWWIIDNLSSYDIKFDMTSNYKAKWILRINDRLAREIKRSILQAEDLLTDSPEIHCVTSTISAHLLDVNLIYIVLSYYNEQCNVLYTSFTGGNGDENSNIILKHLRKKWEPTVPIPSLNI
jgi:hypothetical protein